MAPLFCSFCFSVILLFLLQCVRMSVCVCIVCTNEGVVPIFTMMYGVVMMLEDATKASYFDASAVPH